MSRRALALVAGVGDGLGKAVARRFARAGHLVVLVARKEEKLRRIAGEIAADGGEAVSGRRFCAPTIRSARCSTMSRRSGVWTPSSSMPAPSTGSRSWRSSP